MSLISRVTAAATAAAVAVALVPGTAQAQQTTVTDEPGDTIIPGLDFTSVTVRNGDRHVSFTVSFMRDRPGEVILNVKARNRSRVLIVSRHRRTGPDKLLFFSRGDRPCRRLSSHWARDAATLELRMPARCLNGGNYGAIRFWALIEGPPDQSDVDYAPEKPNGNLTVSEWVARG